MDRGFRRIAIVNRGEAAMRLINAVRELRVETRPRTCARSPCTRAPSARRCSCARPTRRCASTTTEPPGAGSPYLDLAALERALVDSTADAAWVGWGFVAERPEFAELCERLGIVFIGPSAEVMRRLGDKIGAKLLAEQADVPVAAWSGGPVTTLDEARVHAATIGYPLMIKATAGGGGRGIRRVDDEPGLAEAFESARSEGGKAFGDATVFMERVVTGARHVEVQLIADTHGTVWAVGVRDCSMQRRNQKVIEESHCIALTPEQDRDLRAAAVRLADAAGYHNAGTVEFLYQPSEQRFAFLEVNTRLQVEHPVTELTTGLDLVKLQLHVAAGGRLEGEPPPSVGYAIEARLNAEDPQRAFAPAPGTHRDAAAARRARHPRRHRCRRGRRDPARVRLDDRQGHRPRPRPRRGARPAPSGAVADDGGGARRHDEQVVPARPARSARGPRRGDRHVMARPADRRRRAPADAPRRRRPGRRGARRPAT